MSETKKNGTVADLRKAAVEQLSTGKPLAVEKNTHTFAELHADKDLPQRFLIDDLIPDSEVFVIIGEDGIGKTQLMSQLALCIGMKLNHFLGLNLNVKHGNALIVGTEDSKKKFGKAITKIFSGLTSKFDPAKVGVCFTEGSNFDVLDELINEIERELKLRHHDLVLVDALLDCFNMIDGEVNSNSHASKILSKFQHLCNTYECALGVVHHASKTKITEKHKNGKLFLVKNDALGAGRITSKARTVLALTHDFKSVTADSTIYTNFLHAVKVNLQSRHYMKNAIQLTFDTMTLLHDPEGMVDIDSFENSSPDSDERTKKKPMAKEITIDDHQLNSKRAFAEQAVLSRKDLVKKLQRYYGVGANKIEQGGGFLPYLMDLGLIVSVNGMFREGGKSDFKLPFSTQFDDVAVESVLEPAVSTVEMVLPVIGQLSFSVDEMEQDDDDDQPFG